MNNGFSSEKNRGSMIIIIIIDTSQIVQIKLKEINKFFQNWT